MQDREALARRLNDLAGGRHAVGRFLAYLEPPEDFLFLLPELAALYEMQFLARAFAFEHSNRAALRDREWNGALISFELLPRCAEVINKSNLPHDQRVALIRNTFIKG